MIFKTAAAILLFGIFSPLAARTYIWFSSRGKTFSPETIPAQRVAIVFGAGLWRDGSPTPVLKDRVATAANLYFSGKVEKLLMSGDNRFVEYNEPAAMREYARALGVPENAIVLDYAGRRTYDTCYRASAIFGVEKAILVTQKFHLPRALYLCNTMGIEATGVPADLREYRTKSMLYWQTRETIASLFALLDLHLRHPLPVLGEPEPIFQNSTKGTQP
jgi:SanA protein